MWLWWRLQAESASHYPSAEQECSPRVERFLRGIPPAGTGEGNRKGYPPTEGPLLMGEVTNVVTEATHNEAVLVNDVGQNQMISSRYFKFTKKLSIVTSGGFGTMGFGLPAAIGATFGAPDRTICCFFGDGGFQMNIQELGTIMEQQAPVKMILLNNNYLATFASGKT